MRAKGEEKVKDFKGGVNKQRDKLNVHSRDHCELVKDVADLERKLAALLQEVEKRLIVVDIGEESQEVTFRYFDALGSDGGAVEA